MEIYPTTLSLILQLKNLEVFIGTDKYDLCLIDGDHSYEGVKADFNTMKDNANVLVFHDTVSSVCPGVIQFWQELKDQYQETYYFYDFTEQYDEVVKNTGNTYLGIGVAVRKNRL